MIGTPKIVWAECKVQAEAMIARTYATPTLIIGHPPGFVDPGFAALHGLLTPAERLTYIERELGSR